jgi:hypothetical protein
MASIIQNTIIRQIKQLLKDAVVRFSEKYRSGIEDVVISIYADNGKPDPKLCLYIKDKKYNIGFPDLYTKFQKALYRNGFGFDIEKELPLWVGKFIAKSAKDHNIDIDAAIYILAVRDNDVAAKMMYLETRQKKPIPIDYILETN